MKRALLVNPWIYDFAAYDLWSKPLGLLYIGSILCKNNYDCYLLDCMDRHHPKIVSKDKKYGCGHYIKEEIPKPECLKNIPRKYKRYGLPLSIVEDELAQIPKPDVVLVTSIMTYWYLGVYDIIKLIKRFFPQVPVILGGIYATLEYEHAKEYAPADYVFRGNDMGLLTDLVGANWYPKSFAEFPYPAYNLYKELSYAPILTSRGCPMHCPYCAAPLLHKEFEKRDPQSVVDEIEFVTKRYRIKDFAFYDDALLMDSSHSKEILERIIGRGLHCRFHTPNGLHVRSITLEVAQLMYKAGFKTIRLSIETANPKRQLEMGNKASNDDLVSAIDFLEQAGFSRKDIGVYLMIGMRGQSFNEIMDSIRFVSSLGTRVYLAEYSPIKGTKEWERAGLPPHMDPLLTNNSIFPLHDDWDGFQRIKNMARTLNARNALYQR
ncbi:MAG TPA: radical SAM protein [bacterium (Candidatus Stahlbacteria)]|nr:radical SAM protein [Candidatus Stahlbacteria bacterium]